MIDADAFSAMLEAATGCKVVDVTPRCAACGKPLCGCPDHDWHGWEETAASQTERAGV